jgi:hypothetical protein
MNNNPNTNSSNSPPILVVPGENTKESVQDYEEEGNEEKSTIESKKENLILPEYNYNIPLISNKENKIKNEEGNEYEEEYVLDSR